MSEVFKLYGESELELIKNTLRDRVTRWISGWTGNEKNSVKITVQAENIEAIMAECDYRVDYSLDTDKFIRICMSHDFYNNMPALLVTDAASVNSNHTAVVKKILDRTVYDLVRSLSRGVTSRPHECLPIENKEFEAVESRNYSGDVYCDIEIADVSFNVFLPYEVVETLYESNTPANSSTPLGYRKDCNIRGDVRLNVEIGGAEIDFGSLLDMQVGDVVRLDSHITDSLQVKTEDGEVVCRAYLGKQGNNKAIKVIL